MSKILQKITRNGWKRWIAAPFEGFALTVGAHGRGSGNGNGGGTWPWFWQR